MPMKKPWHQSKVHVYKKPDVEKDLNKSEFEAEYLKKKYGWKDGMYYV